MTDPLSREVVVTLLLNARTITECEMAIKLAERYLERNPDDQDLGMMIEQPWNILQGLLDASRSALP